VNLPIAWINEEPIRDYLKEAMWIGILLAAAIASFALVRWVLLPLLRRVSKKSATEWDDILLDSALLRRLSYLAPLYVVHTGVAHFFEEAPWSAPVQKVAALLMVLVGTLAVSALLNAVDRIYRTFDVARHRPIKGYLQIAKMVVFAFGGVILLALISGQSIGYFVGGLGAMTAVLLLIFKDTILCLVASVQLTQNDMLRVGDWIEMPGQKADGDVIDIALHTVKVQNWDKTVTTIPTSKLIQDSFKNWRFMPEAGGRRIKRSLAIDMATVRFLTDEEIDRFSRFAPLSDYMKGKVDELAGHNEKHSPGPELKGDPRRLTNIGTLRAYVEHYLKHHPHLHQSGMTLLVRQLQPTPRGLPLEIYTFTNDTAWVRYEAIQADIFDHILAKLPEFGLRAFQEPTGEDVRNSYDSAS